MDFLKITASLCGFVMTRHKITGSEQLLGACLAELAGPIRIVDVGSADYEANAQVPYGPLLRSQRNSVIGFDPQGGGVQQAEPVMCLTLPFIVGDGNKGTFRHCAAPMTSSLLEPNMLFLKRFENLPELCRVIAAETVETVALDDLPEVAGTDYLKIDVQGASLIVLQNAVKLLSKTLFVHVEVEFAPIYKDAAYFGDVEAFLRANGFEFHHFLNFGTRRELSKSYAIGARATRLLWADCVFVASAERIDMFEPSQLAKMAVIAQDCYGCTDLAHHCLCRLDVKAGTAFAEALEDLVASTGGSTA